MTDDDLSSAETEVRGVEGEGGKDGCVEVGSALSGGRARVAAGKGGRLAVVEDEEE